MDKLQISLGLRKELEKDILETIVNMAALARSLMQTVEDPETVVWQNRLPEEFGGYDREIPRREARRVAVKYNDRETATVILRELRRKFPRDEWKDEVPLFATANFLLAYGIENYMPANL